ncbi:MAG: imidazole glycerol phosphate synthase subunit HisH [Deltaproteobacteria bacterium]|nr:imidazole glycerol phosphate synthase subunit HisH [Deltaproteobacteria bacterium]
MIVIIDSKIANLGSVVAAFRHLGEAVTISDDPDIVASAEGLVLPGVGAFADGMESLQRLGLDGPIRSAAAKGKPILGICLGMQLLAEESEEFGNHKGLGLIPGRVVRLAPKSGERVPNIGWCDVYPAGDSSIFCDITAGTAFYFVHSYHFLCNNRENSVAVIDFGHEPVTVAVERGNIFGVQFHPEKSQDAGLGVLEAFVTYVKKESCHAS